MKRYLFFVVFLIFFTTQVRSHETQSLGSIEYNVSMSNPNTHYFEVEIQLKNYDEDFVDFKIPVWTPGSYLIREYAKNVEGFLACSMNNKKVLKFHKINKFTWRIEHKKEESVLIRYRVYAFEGSIRMSYLDDNHAFIMSNTLLMFVEDLRSTSSVLTINVPDQWKKISTSLTRLEGKPNVFYVPDYDILIDSPIEIGNHEIIEFMAAGVPHEVVMYGASNYKPEQIKRDLTKIVETATEIFEENPNEKYTFFVHHSDHGSGGLEHLNSTALGVSRWTYTNPKSYNYFLSLAAHEYFHLWMVKRLKPIEFDFINYDQETYTDLLWVMEGITSYFEEKIMLRSGFHDVIRFINNLLSAMSKIQNTPGAGVQSVAEASFDAWIKYYKRNENSDNNQISYYNKGMILGALLDLEIIDGSEGEKSLDDVINQLYYKFYKNKGKGIVAEDLKKVAEKASGRDLNDFFSDYVYGTKDLDNEKYLHSAGIGLIEINNSINARSIGVKFKQENNGLYVTSLIKGGSAYDNGIYVGDELISINSYRIYTHNLNSLLDQFKIGEKVTFLINRKGIVKSIELDIRKDKMVSYTYEILDNRTRLQEKVYQTWIGR
ncbi:MAG: M61 family metallopeptidase [Cyclobacteriaceae bacterium]|nr:M61 family metallopeptidase [Cyclobacteriaceae bacterium]